MQILFSDVWVDYGGKEYFFGVEDGEVTDWHYARWFCNTRGGHLASIHSSSESSFIKGQVGRIFNILGLGWSFVWNCVMEIPMRISFGLHIHFLFCNDTMKQAIKKYKLCCKMFLYVVQWRIYCNHIYTHSLLSCIKYLIQLIN